MNIKENFVLVLCCNTATVVAINLVSFVYSNNHFKMNVSISSVEMLHKAKLFLLWMTPTAFSEKRSLLKEHLDFVFLQTQQCVVKLLHTIDLQQ